MNTYLSETDVAGHNLVDFILSDAERYRRHRRRNITVPVTL